MRVLRSESGRKVTGALMAIALCVLAGALTHSAGPATPNWNRPPTLDFPLAGGSYSNQRYSALSQINRSNITKLGGVWSMLVEERGLGGTLDGTPVVVDGVIRHDRREKRAGHRREDRKRQVAISSGIGRRQNRRE